MAERDREVTGDGGHGLARARADASGVKVDPALLEKARSLGA